MTDEAKKIKADNPTLTDVDAEWQAKHNKAVSENLSNIRDSKGELPAFAWLGGYPVLYLDRDNSTLCPKCANKSDSDPDELPQFKPVAYDVYYEGPTIQCDNCNADIESAYGDPDAENPDVAS